MRAIFDLDNRFFRFMGRIGDIIFLNVIFVISCIPIITIGAATTALYDVSMGMVKNQESYLFKGYFSAMKSNFKKSTIVWLIVVGLLVVLLLDIKVSNVYTSTIWSIVHYVLVILFVIVCILASYVFPVLAKFENTYLQTFKFTFLIAFKHMFTTVMVVIFHAIFPFCMIASNESLVHGLIGFGFFGFATVAYLNSMVLLRIFEKYI